MKNSPRTEKIHKLLDSTIVPPEALYEWPDKSDRLFHILKPLNEYFVQNCPKKLYKMRTVNERSLQALENEYVFLTRADHFNDPYDCFLTFNVEELKERIAQYLSNESMEETLAQNKIHFPVGELFPDKNSFLKIFEHQRTVFLQMSDQNLKEVSSDLQSNTYVASLTENIQSPVLWAHYAHNHEGFAIEYQFRSEMFCPRPMIVTNFDYPCYGWCSILPIHYSEFRADATQLASWLALCKWTKFLFKEEYINYDLSPYLTDLLLKTKLCLKKSLDWAYEHEWRLMISHNWPNQIGADSSQMPYPPSAIYLGERISDDNKKRLKEIAKRKSIPVYQMYINQSGKKYQMEIGH